MKTPRQARNTVMRKKDSVMWRGAFLQGTATAQPQGRACKQVGGAVQSAAASVRPCGPNRESWALRSYPEQREGRSHWYTHTRARMAQSDQSPGPARTGQAQALVVSRFSSGRKESKKSHDHQRLGAFL